MSRSSSQKCKCTQSFNKCLQLKASLRHPRPSRCYPLLNPRIASRRPPPLLPDMCQESSRLSQKTTYSAQGSGRDVRNFPMTFQVVASRRGITSKKLPSKRTRCQSRRHYLNITCCQKGLGNTTRQIYSFKSRRTYLDSGIPWMRIRPGRDQLRFNWHILVGHAIKHC